MESQAKQIGQQFCQAYYSALQTNKAGLLQFYGQNSIMNYNGSTASGLKEIQEKVESFSFEKVQLEKKDLIPNRRLGRTTFGRAQQSLDFRHWTNANGRRRPFQILTGLPHPPQQPGRLLLSQRHLQTSLLTNHLTIHYYLLYFILH